MKISIYKTSSYPVSVKKVRSAVEAVFKNAGLGDDAEASVAIVSHTSMVDYAKKYLKETQEQAEAHPVLSFPTSEIEGPFLFPPDKSLHVGEIIVSYPKARETAKEEGRLVDDVVADLAEHGALHLVGVHHD